MLHWLLVYSTTPNNRKHSSLASMPLGLITISPLIGRSVIKVIFSSVMIIFFTWKIDVSVPDLHLSIKATTKSRMLWNLSFQDATSKPHPLSIPRYKDRVLGSLNYVRFEEFNLSTVKKYHICVI